MKYTNVITLRNIEPFTFAYLTSAAAADKNNRSREQYVKDLLKNIAIKGNIESYQKTLEASLDDFVDVIESLSNVINALRLEIEELKGDK